MVGFFGSNAIEVTQPSRGRTASHVVVVVAASAARDATMSPLLVPAITRFGSLGAIAIALTRPPSGMTVLALVHDVAAFDVRYRTWPPIHKRFGSAGSIASGATKR